MRDKLLIAMRVPLSIAVALFAANAHGHTHLKASNPVDGAVVTEMPSAVTLTFTQAARITAVSLQKDQELKHRLKAPSAAAAREISVAVPPLGPGSYAITWRVVSDDGHIMAGELHFKVAAIATPAESPKNR